jgi:Mg2+/Co2+ transporter CorB
MDFQLHLPPWLAGILILALLVVSGFFAVAETALVSSSRPRLLALARKGGPRAIRVGKLRERQDQVLSAILFGNNVVNVFASSIATGLLIDVFGPAGIAYAAVAMTVLVVIFAEMIPKTYALNRADRVILAIVPALEVSMKILIPLNRINRAIVHGILRLLGAQRPHRSAEAAVEELRGAIELHAAPDPDVRKERLMLRSILDLADVQVSQIMVHRRDMVSIDADRPPGEILEQALLSRHTRVPLWRGQPDNIVGVLHAKSLLQALRAHGGDADAMNILAIAARPWFIPESTSLLDQLEAFRRRREHFSLVVDEYGALLGIVTLEDILEEIVGDIAERHEFKLPGVRPQPDGTLVVDGTVTLRDLNREFDWRLPDEAAATIAGLILHEARCIPDVGQVFNFYGFRFEILRRKRNQVAALRISPPARAAAVAPVHAVAS